MLNHVLKCVGQAQFSLYVGIQLKSPSWAKQHRVVIWWKVFMLNSNTRARSLHTTWGSCLPSVVDRRRNQNQVLWVLLELPCCSIFGLYQLPLVGGWLFGCCLVIPCCLSLSGCDAICFTLTSLDALLVDRLILLAIQKMMRSNSHDRRVRILYHVEASVWAGVSWHGQAAILWTLLKSPCQGRIFGVEAGEGEGTQVLTQVYTSTGLYTLVLHSSKIIVLTTSLLVISNSVAACNSERPGRKRCGKHPALLLH